MRALDGARVAARVGASHVRETGSGLGGFQPSPPVTDSLSP